MKLVIKLCPNHVYYNGCQFSWLDPWVYFYVFPTVVHLRATLGIIFPNFFHYMFKYNIYICIDLQVESKQSEFQRKKELGRVKGLLMLSLKTG